MPVGDSRPKEAPIKYYSDYQRNWPTLIEPVRRGKYVLQSTDVLSIHGDAPKDFIRIKEHVPGHPSGRLRHWNAYIAKIGSKFYPNESITEQLLTRVGQAIGVAIAESQLIAPLVEMLAFDAIIGHHDRHPANWGIIVPVTKGARPRFAPVYDTARALYWNLSEKRLAKMLADEQSFAAYIRRSTPQIGFDGYEKIDHFELIGSIFYDYPAFRSNISKFADSRLIMMCGKIVEEEFSELMSKQRRELIKRCLFERHSQFCDALT